MKSNSLYISIDRHVIIVVIIKGFVNVIIIKEIMVFIIISISARVILILVITGVSF